MSDCRLVIVEWWDSRQPTSAWRYLRNIEAGEAVRCASVGWLLYDTAAVKVLCPNMGDLDDDDVQASGVITIPTCSVISMRNLTETSARNPKGRGAGPTHGRTLNGGRTQHPRLPPVP